MGEQEFVFSFQEMHRVSVVCGRCGTEIIFDAANRDTAIPSNCPSCQADLRASSQCFSLYRQFYQRMQDAGTPIRVRVAEKK